MWYLVVEVNECVQVMATKAGVDLANVKHSVNPFCEIAVEVMGILMIIGMISLTLLLGSTPNEGGWSPV